MWSAARLLISVQCANCRHWLIAPKQTFAIRLLAEQTIVPDAKGSRCLLLVAAYIGAIDFPGSTELARM